VAVRYAVNGSFRHSPGTLNEPISKRRSKSRRLPKIRLTLSKNTETENKDKNNDPAKQEEQKQDAKTENEAQLTINGAAHNELIH